MTLEVWIVFGLLALALVLFITERVSFDVTALIILAVLMLTGILSPAEGLSGFSSEATITIGGMFILSEGIRRTGGLERVETFFSYLGKENFWLAVFLMMLTIGTVSAFINNTAAVAIFIPVIVSVSASLRVSASKLLMPLSFASMFGGVCTLIGTSTNILVSSMYEERGGEALGMFEFAPLGLIFAVVGFGYLFTWGIRHIPSRRPEEDLTESYAMNEYLTDVVLGDSCDLVGREAAERDLLADLDLDVIQHFPAHGDGPSEGRRALRSGDVMRIRGSAAEIRKLVERHEVTVLPERSWSDPDLQNEVTTLVEAVVAPESAIESQPLGKIDFPRRFGAHVLAIRHHGELQQAHLAGARLSGGDALLMVAPADRVRDIGKSGSFVLVSEVATERYRRSKMPIALTVLAAAVISAAVGLVPIVVAVAAACVLLLVTGCLTNEEAYEAVNWQVILLLAGVLPLGIAMDKTGAADILASSVLSMFADYGPHAVVSAFFLLSMLLTNVISNQATAALLVPIAIQSAASMGMSSKPLLMAVTFAASLSFMTPVGYQTNTLIYGPGQYRFSDFFRIGAPLNLLFWIIGTLAIPWLWPA